MYVVHECGEVSGQQTFAPGVNVPKDAPVGWYIVAPQSHGSVMALPVS